MTSSFALNVLQEEAIDVQREVLRFLVVVGQAELLVAVEALQLFL